MSKKRKPARDNSPESRFLRAFDGFLDAEGPVMITGWATVIEYMDDQGAIQLAAFASETPPWRISGMLHEGNDLLTTAHEFDDWQDE